MSSSNDSLSSDTSYWQRYMEAEVPLSKSMNLKVEALTPAALLTAPLAPNQNNKGTAFAGSLNAALSLAGWIVAQNWADATFKKYDVVLYKSEISYDLPVMGDFKVHAEMEPATDVTKIRNLLKKRGKARMTIEGKVTQGLSEKVRFRGHYVILSKI